MRIFAIVQGREYELDNKLCKVSKGEDGGLQMSLPSESGYDGGEIRLKPLSRIGSFDGIQLPLMDGGVLVATKADFRTSF